MQEIDAIRGGERGKMGGLLGCTRTAAKRGTQKVPIAPEKVFVILSFFCLAHVCTLKQRLRYAMQRRP